MEIISGTAVPNRTAVPLSDKSDRSDGSDRSDAAIDGCPLGWLAVVAGAPDRVPLS